MNKMILIDGSSLMHRAFHALPDMRTKTGTPTGAIYGFVSMLFKLVEYRPSHIAVAFDMSGPTFRHSEYSEYKAGRKPTPPELITQFDIIRRLLNEMGIKILELQSYEADDIIGTMAKKANDKGLDVLIVTGDKDSFQLINEKTHVLYTKRGISETVEYDEAALRERYGLAPQQMVDLKGLMGDASDNLPGIPGVGEKTALRLLEAYGSIEEVLKRGAVEEKGALQKKIAENYESAMMSYKLGRIDTDVPIDASIDDCAFDESNMWNARGMMAELQLRSLMKRLPNSDEKNALPFDDNSEQEITIKEIIVSDIEQLRALIPKLSKTEKIAFHYGEQLSVCNGEILVKVKSGGTLLDAGLNTYEALQALKEVLESEQKKLVYDAKSLMHELDKLSITLNNVYFDAMIVDYLLNAVSPSKNLEELVNERLNNKAADAFSLFLLCAPMLEEMDRLSLSSLYWDIELPLMHVLYDMEKTGFRVDVNTLNELSNLFGEQRRELEKKIIELAGVEFNILSPKQLGMVLFEKLKLPPGKKNTQGYSTSADILENLIDQHEIVPLVIEYRFISKLKSTFVDGLLQQINPKTGRVHTTFNQAITATGRISSTEPNLQNIPIRTELGREIRRAFVASDGNLLVDADYSQIELRVLAHMSGDEVMIDAFNNGIDIHAITASEIADVPLNSVTPEQRREAKAVNFGIVYGISDFGLSRNLNISRAKAAKYINSYLAKYKGIAKYMNDTVTQAHEKGYALTLFGRRRAMHELKSSNYNTRSFGERVAKNMPIQGSAADIIKLAMVKVFEALKQNNLKAKLILQVHDELIIDTPKEEVEIVKKLLADCMQNAVKLKVPLIADVHVGENWHDAK